MGDGRRARFRHRGGRRLSLDRPMEVAAANAATSESQSATGSLVRTDPGINPWVERDIPPPRPKISAEPQAAPQPEAVPIPDSPPTPFADPQPASVPILAKQPKLPKPQPKQQKATRSSGEKKIPAGRRADPPSEPSPSLPSPAWRHHVVPHHRLPRPRERPRLDSVTRSALNKGVVHLPNTSLP